MDSQKQIRYLELRQQLAELNCPSSFGFESVDAVEFLVRSVVSTSNAYSLCQEKEARLAADLALAQAQLFPLRKENARLARENHQLHLDSISVKEANAAKLAEQQNTLKSLQDRIAELQFLSRAKDEMIERVERGKEKIREAYESIANTSMKGSSVAKRVIRLSSPVHPAVSKSLSSPSRREAEADPESSLVQNLREKLEETSICIASLERENGLLQAAVRQRDNELTRKAQADSTHVTAVDADLVSNESGWIGGRSSLNASSVNQLMMSEKSNRLLIDQLNSQLEFLNEQLALRESQLVELANKLQTYEGFQAENIKKSTILEKIRAENHLLASKLTSAEQQIRDLTVALDPEGSVSVDDLMHLVLTKPKTDDAKIKREDDSVVSAMSSVSARPLAASKRSVGSAQPTSSTRKAPLASISLRDRRADAHKREPSAVHSLTAERDALLEEVKSLREELRIRSLENTDSEQKSPWTVKPHSTGSNSASSTTAAAAEALLKERLRRSESRINQLQNQANEWKAKAELWAQTLAERELTVTMLESAKKELEVGLQKCTAQLAERQSDAGNSDNVLMRVQSELMAVRKELTTTSLVNDELRGEIVSLRKIKAELSHSDEQGKRKLEAFENELFDKKKENERLGTALSDLQCDLAKYRINHERLEDQVKVSATRCASLTEELSHSEKLLSEARADLTTARSQLNSTRTRMQLEQHKSRDGGEENGANLDTLRKNIKRLEEENKRLSDESWSSSQVLSELKARADGGQRLEELFKKERNQLESQISEKNEQIASLENSVRKFETLVDRNASELLRLNGSVEALSKSESFLNEQLAASKASLHRAEADIKLLQKRLQSASEAYSESKDFISGNARALGTVAERLEHAEQEVTRLTVTVNSLVSEKAAAEDECERLSRQCAVLSRRGESDREEVKRSFDLKQEAEMKCNELKTLVLHLEANSKAILERNSRLIAALDEGDVNLKKLDKEVSQLHDVISSRDEAIKELRQMASSVESERDRVLESLEKADAQVGSQSKHIQRMQSSLEQGRVLLEKAESRLQDTGAELAASQNQCMLQDKRIQSLREEVLVLKKRISQQTSEVGGAAEDLINLTRENQIVNAELTDTCEERDRLRLRISEISQLLADKEQINRGLEIEKGDLMDAYREVLKEKRQLEMDLGVVSSSKQKLSLSTQQMQDRISDLTGQVSALSGAETRWSVERASLGQQIEDLNEQLVRAQRTIEVVVADNRRMMQDTHSLRQSNALLNERVQLVVRRAAAASDSTKVLSSRLSSVERERDAVRALMSLERQKSSDLAQIVESTREQVAIRELESLSRADD